MALRINRRPASYELYNAMLEPWTKEYEGPRFHAVLCDPPYGIEFMGKGWDQSNLYLYKVKRWGQCMLEVLHPGAIVLMFGGTRTWHHLASGMEMAGFELFDTVMWVYGQGFPKSLDISKALDKQSGRAGKSVAALKNQLRMLYAQSGKTNTQIDAECGFSASSGYLSDRAPWTNILPSPEKWAVIKKVIGCGDELDRIFEQAHRDVVESKKHTNSYHPGDDTEKVTLEVTAPSSQEAKNWEGYGTAMKPSWEPILVFRAPDNGKTHAQLAVEYGSGALNIDGGRIPHNEECRMLPDQHGDNPGTFYQQGGRHKPTLELKPEGRWPANLILDEAAGAQLDLQTGQKSGTYVGHNRNPAEIGNSQIYGAYYKNTNDAGYGDVGGASRFFYCTKASPVERDAGLDGVEPGSGVRSNAPRESEEEKTKARINNHPTVKPISLGKYLATLILPPKSVRNRSLLVPFAGTGSEIIGALQAGWDRVVGIEMNEKYCGLAEARIKYWRGKL